MSVHNARTNGALYCPLDKDDWSSHRDKTDDMVIKLALLEDHLNRLVINTKHLEKLDHLADIKDKLLESATGRNHVDIGTVRTLFRILAVVVVALTGIVVFLLTGEKFNFLQGLHH